MTFPVNVTYRPIFCEDSDFCRQRCLITFELESHRIDKQINYKSGKNVNKIPKLFHVEALSMDKRFFIPSCVSFLHSWCSFIDLFFFFVVDYAFKNWSQKKNYYFTAKNYNRHKSFMKLTITTTI